MTSQFRVMQAIAQDPRLQPQLVDLFIQLRKDPGMKKEIENCSCRVGKNDQSDGTADEAANDAADETRAERVPPNPSEAEEAGGNP